MPFDTYTLERIEKNDSELKEIHLRGFITDKDIKDLVTAAQKGHNTNLRSIFIYDAKISDEGARMLAELENIEKLDLNDNEIGDEGACAIAGMRKLKYLSLAGNQIGEKGAAALAKNQTIESLILFANEKITEIGISQFLNNTTLTGFVFDKERFSESLVEAIKQQLLMNEEALTLVSRAKRPRSFFAAATAEGSEERILEALLAESNVDGFKDGLLRTITIKCRKMSSEQRDEFIHDLQEGLESIKRQTQTVKQNA